MKIKHLFYFLAMILVVASVAYGASVTLQWDAPTTREDGSALNPVTDLAGYQIGYGPSSGSYPNLVNVPNPGTSHVTYLLTSTFTGTVYFSVRAQDNYQQFSAWGSEVAKFFPPSPPSSPKNISFVTGVEVF
jgi:hypothetical protein